MAEHFPDNFGPEDVYGDYALGEAEQHMDGFEVVDGDALAQLEGVVDVEATLLGTTATLRLHERILGYDRTTPINGRFDLVPRGRDELYARIEGLDDAELRRLVPEGWARSFIAEADAIKAVDDAFQDQSATSYDALDRISLSRMKDVTEE
ncbi:MAG TPA: hypothetical protein VLA92_00125 [Candidatus Saccharimonadales bacterium]|nr:hypothetical protein [Candidatus Saccharimonadales bacterium]